MLKPYNPTGSTIHVNFTTTKTHRWQTDARFCHLNWIILDSDWEGEFCRVVEKVAVERLEAGIYPRIKSYVKNFNLGFEVPYIYQGLERHYLPDFIVVLDGGNGENDLLNLVVEIKGYRGEDAKFKKEVMDVYWIPGLNRLGLYGRWAFAEFRDIFDIEADFKAKVEAEFVKMMEQAIHPISHQFL
jgi:type III restriction enzyme